ncbi:MAG: hypothetical protein J3R72DRAFT_16500 [Linnemannia gamsii]|nr:MAG: hypothetical protein J3R72DRAFT_16500 [Linnemannia gamsii]
MMLDIVSFERVGIHLLSHAMDAHPFFLSLLSLFFPFSFLFFPAFYSRTLSDVSRLNTIDTSFTHTQTYPIAIVCPFFFPSFFLFSFLFPFPFSLLPFPFFYPSFTLAHPLTLTLNLSSAPPSLPSPLLPPLTDQHLHLDNHS